MFDTHIYIKRMCQDVHVWPHMFEMYAAPCWFLGIKLALRSISVRHDCINAAPPAETRTFLIFIGNLAERHAEIGSGHSAHHAVSYCLISERSYWKSASTSCHCIVGSVLFYRYVQIVVTLPPLRNTRFLSPDYWLQRRSPLSANIRSIGNTINGTKNYSATS